MTALFAAFVLLALVATIALVVHFHRKDTRVTHQPPIDITPAIAQLRAWRADRLEHNPQLRVLRGGLR